MRLLVILLTLLFASPAWATTYYVNKAGSDANSCATAQSATDANAKLTIAAGAACLSAGDTLSVGGGTYVESLLNPLPSGTSSSARTRMTCEGVRTCILAPNDGAQSGNIIFLSSGRNYLEIDNFNLSHASQTGTINSALRTSDGVTFTGLYIHDNEVDGTGKTMGNTYAAFTVANGVNNSTYANNYIHAIDSGDGSPGAHGFYVRGDSNIFEHNDISGHDGYGIQFYSGADAVDGNVARYNYIHDDSANGTVGGIYVGTSSGNQAHNNVIARVHRGLTVRGSNTKIYNHSIYSVTTGMDVSASTGCEIKNNALPSESLGTADADCTYSKNIATNGDIGTTVTPSQLWLDAAGNNFSLLESSAGIDAGTTVSISGVSSVGAAYDVGVFEAPVRTSAVVENATPTKYAVSYSIPSQSVRGGVGLQTPTVANWAMVVAGGAATESSAAIVGTSIAEITLGSAVTNGQSLTDAMTRSAAPTLTDNVCIGDPNTLCLNAHIRSHAAASGTNKVGVGSPTWNVVHARQIDWYSSVSTPAWKRLENAAAGAQAGGRVALAITIEGTGADPGSTAFELYFNTGGGDALITDSVASNAVAFTNDAPSFMDQVAISSLLSGLTCPHVTFVAGAVIGKQTSQPNIDLSQDSCTTLIVLLQTKSDATGTINVKPKLPGGTAISYGVQPAITIKKAEAGS